MDTETVIMRLIESAPEREEEFRLVQFLAKGTALTIEIRQMIGAPTPEKYIYADTIPVAQEMYDIEARTRLSMPGDKDKIISEATVLALRILNS